MDCLGSPFFFALSTTKAVCYAEYMTQKSKTLSKNLPPKPDGVRTILDFLLFVLILFGLSYLYIRSLAPNINAADWYASFRPIDLATWITTAVVAWFAADAMADFVLRHTRDRQKR